MRKLSDFGNCYVEVATYSIHSKQMHDIISFSFFAVIIVKFNEMREVILSELLKLNSLLTQATEHRASVGKQLTETGYWIVYRTELNHCRLRTCDLSEWRL